MTRVVVIGGGVVGLTAAYSLRQRGCEVTVVEAGEAGAGASVVNAGWICPSLPDPIPSPGLVRTSLKWMARSDSPLYIQPRPNREMMRWMLTFWRNCNARHYDAGTEAIANLNRRTLQCYDDMRAAGVEFEEHRQGLLFAFLSTRLLEKSFESHSALVKHGVRKPQLLNALQIHRLEPALHDDVAGGFWYEQDRHVRPDSLVEGLLYWLQRHGVRLRTNVTVTGLERSGRTITNVITSDGRIEVDAVLLCAGVWSKAIAADAGVRLPIQAGKGYHLDYTPPPNELKHPLDLPEFRMACTPMSAFTRLAGTMEFSGINETIRPERVAAIAKGGSLMLRNWPTDQEATTIGSGLRPVSADGLPIIGLMPGFHNFATATGHGMLGLTLAAVTADLIADLLTTGTPARELAPFDPGRFGRI